MFLRGRETITASGRQHEPKENRLRYASVLAANSGIHNLPLPYALRISVPNYPITSLNGLVYGRREKPDKIVQMAT